MLTVSGATAAVLSILLTALSINVSRLRIKYRVSYGHADHRDLEVAIRAHGNALEQVMLFMILLICAETMTTTKPLLAWAAATFVFVRLVHSVALFARLLPVRQIAHTATVLLQLLLAGFLLYAVWSR